MHLILYILLVSSCSVIAWQDFRQRAVVWIVFPILTLTLLALQWLYTGPFAVAISLGFNLLLLGLILLILWFYIVVIRKKNFLNVSLGLGDILFLLALAFGFPTATFIVLLCSGLLAALLAHGVVSVFRKWQTIPLAGLMAFFLLTIYTVAWLWDIQMLYLM